MFTHCSLRYISKTSENFTEYQREHRSNIGQHGIIYNNYETINMWNEKQADNIKGHDYVMKECLTPEETSINRSAAKIDWLVSVW